MEAVVYGHLEKAHGALLELHLKQTKRDLPSFIVFFWRIFSRKESDKKCCEAKKSLREAITIARTGKPLSFYATEENLRNIFSSP